MLDAERCGMIQLDGKEYELPGAPGARRAGPGATVVRVEPSGGAIANSGVKSV